MHDLRHVYAKIEVYICVITTLRIVVVISRIRIALLIRNLQGSR